MEKIDSKVINAPIRWAGSKKKLLNEMLHAFEADKDVYIEPFLGSGIVLLNVLENQMYRKYYVNDINNNLILFYNTLKNDSAQLIKRIEVLCREYNSFSDDGEKWDYFYKKRDSFNKKQIRCVTRSALFWFLMKAGYNGVYRVNSEGKFNVPCGKRDKIVCNKEKMEEISKKIQNVEFSCMDYNLFIDMVLEKEKKKSIFMYCDPPYMPETKASQKHILYTQNGFEHEKFMEYIDEICNKSDIAIMISMAETKSVVQIYKKYSRFTKVKIDEIVRKVNPTKQMKSKEIAFVNYEVGKNSMIIP